MLRIAMGKLAADQNSAALSRQYFEVRSYTEELAAPLSPEDQMVQSMPDASPTKWHRAHTTWFFETFVLKNFTPEHRDSCPGYEVLFNSYYNSVGAQFARPARGMLSRPSCEQVAEYRRRVDAAMNNLLARSDQEDLRQLTLLGLHHEQQHQELLLTDIKHALSRNPLAPVYRKGRDPVDAGNEPPPVLSQRRQEEGDRISGVSDIRADSEFVGFEGGLVRIGFEGTGFCYDNETPAHDVIVQDLEIAARPLSNRHVLDFIEGGGYEDPLLWLADGWAWVQRENRRAPLYWTEEEDGNWHHFTLHGTRPILLEETACHLSYFEADAMARFWGARLPTEQEWEHVARLQLSSNHACLEVNSALDQLRPGVPGRREPGQLSQLFGGVWEWTQSPYAAYPGYRPAKGAVGEYNGKFMHNQMVLRGGSCVTPPGHIRASYRNFWPGSTSFQFSGARLLKG